MKLLLDTHVLLWAASRSNKLPKAGYALLSDPNNELFFSAVNIWEIAIKRSLNRPDLQVQPSVLRNGLLSNGYIEQVVTSAHAVVVDTLPPLHRDPFDRMLVAQSMTEGITLLTVDPLVSQYAGPIIKL